MLSSKRSKNWEFELATFIINVHYIGLLKNQTLKFDTYLQGTQNSSLLIIDLCALMEH